MQVAPVVDAVEVNPTRALEYNPAKTAIPEPMVMVILVVVPSVVPTVQEAAEVLAAPVVVKERAVLVCKMITEPARLNGTLAAVLLVRITVVLCLPEVRVAAGTDLDQAPQKGTMAPRIPAVAAEEAVEMVASARKVVMVDPVLLL